VQKHFGDRLAFVFREFPLADIHPLAEAAAETAEFAGDHSRFWDMHDGLYRNQDRLGLPLFLALAEALGLSPDELGNALSSHRYAPRIEEDLRGGIRSGVQGTPSFFINGRRHEGAYDVPHLVAALEAADRHP
jgi:protein-disulfide isomerase